MTALRYRKPALVAIMTTVIAASFTSVPATAAVTAPVAGQTVRGEILIDEDRGGTEDPICGLAGYLGDSTITVTRIADGVTVLNRSKGSAGPWSTIWDSRAESANGFFRIQTVARDRGPWYLLCPTTSRVLSTITVYLENFLRFTDDLGAGSVLVNPYLKMFRLQAGTYDSGNVAAPDMQIVSGPAAHTPCDPVANPGTCTPAAPSLHSACADPASPDFAPFVVRHGPQGCLDPNPIPPVGAPTTPALPDPNEPPDPPHNPQCSAAPCSDGVIAIVFAGERLALTGVFHIESRVFAAGAITTGNLPAPVVMHHLPSPPSTP